MLVNVVKNDKKKGKQPPLKLKSEPCIYIYIYIYIHMHVYKYLGFVASSCHTTVVFCPYLHQKNPKTTKQRKRTLKKTQRATKTKKN